MRIPRLHGWDLTPSRAMRLQADLADRVRLVPPPRHLRLVAGADCAFSRDGRNVLASVIVLSLPGLEVVEVLDGVAPVRFPYVPGLLSFREAPALLDAFSRLESRPDVVLFDGQGLAHPRRMGLACHLGLWLGLPTVGCAKSRLTGTAEEPGPRRGSYRTLRDGGEAIGRLVRTRDGVKPLYVSPGHLCDIPGAMRLTLRCGAGYRLPEPTRAADIRVAKRRGQPMRNTPSAVLFDLDDTLADTAGTLVLPAQRRAVGAMVEAGLGASVEEAHAALLEIRKLDPGAPFFRRLVERFGADDPEACREAGRGAFFGNPPDGIRLVPGARRLLAVLRERGVRLFLVTYGVPARQERKIDLLGIRECFDEVVVVPLTEAPDKREVFSGILDRLDVPPSEVWVVGDRPPGEIRAGNALGACTIRIRRGEFMGLAPRDATEEADLTVGRLEDLLGEIRG